MSTDSNSLNDSERVIIEHYRKLPEENKKLLSDLLSSSKNINNIDVLNLLNIPIKDDLQTTATLRNTNDTSDNKLIESNVPDEASQLNQTECKYLLSALGKSNLEHSDLNTQDENILMSITK